MSPPSPRVDGGCVVGGGVSLSPPGPREQLLGPAFGPDSALAYDPLVPPGGLLGMLAAPGFLPLSAPLPHPLGL